MRQIRSPFFLVNPKSYLYGQKCVDLAIAADQAAQKYNKDVFYTCPYTDFRLIKNHVKKVILTAQHMDFLYPGRGQGAVLPEALKDAGVEAVYMNHTERQLSLENLKKTMERAREMDFIKIVCVNSVAEGLAVARLNPDILVCEPSDLIGSGRTASDDYVADAVGAIKKENPDVKIVIGASIASGGDVRRLIQAGADGAGSTSGIVLAADPALKVDELIQAL